MTAASLCRRCVSCLLDFRFPFCGALLCCAVCLQSGLTGSVCFAEDKPAETEQSTAEPASGTPVSSPASPAEPQATSAENSNESSAETAEEAAEVQPGHSYHGEVFNTGPRQSAYLMGGTGEIHFPISSTVPQVQEFFNQGVGQLHGFWFFEAERSFRQAAALDPNCAISFWGMAMANENNEKRARDFIARADELKEHADPFELLWIQSLHDAYFKEYKDEKERWQAYILALEKIVHAYPEEVEAKAFLALHTFWNKSGKALGVTSRVAVDALLDKVFAANPMHPAHHYRIHLWDNKKSEKALGSSALCGQSAPNIAHMWHMSGHIYSGLKRYEDACWQQEASSRVDHRHMIHDRVLPTKIHNYVHNQEWLTRNLIKTGRIRDALAIARNLVELPRHPRHNVPEKSNSAVSRGRTRLLDVLTQLELWDELRELAETPYLQVENDEDSHLRKRRFLAIAHFAQGDEAAGEAVLEELNSQLAGHQQELKAGDPQSARSTRSGNPRSKAAKSSAASESTSEEDKTTKDSEADQADSSDQVNSSDTAESNADPATAAPAEAENQAKSADQSDSKQPAENWSKRKKTLEGQIKKLQQAVTHIEAERASLQGDHKGALGLFKKVTDLPKTRLARAQAAAGNMAEAVKLAKQGVDSARNEVYPLAWYAKLLHEQGKQAEARKAFEQLRKLSAFIDTDLSVFAELGPLAESANYEADWLREYEHPADVGERPPLDSLGPLVWEPAPAPSWSLTAADENNISLEDYRGKPVVVIFYLGFGCLHCVEQLATFAPLAEEYQAAGIELMAIGSDELADLQAALKDYSQQKTIPFPLLSDASLETFEKYRCVDNFENQALHGTFLIDANGLIRWQDIGAEPFTDAPFLLQEAQRLLSLPDAHSTSEEESTKTTARH